MAYLGNQPKDPISVSTNAPSIPKNGDVWFNSALGETFVYYDDGDTAQWVQTNPSGQQGPTGPTGPAGANGEVLRTELDAYLQVANLSNLSTSLIPSANVTYDLGSTTKYWKDLYLSGNTIFLGSAQITLNDNGGIDLPAGSRTGGTAIGTGAAGSSVTSYANSSIFPSSGNSVGDFAFATNTKAVYIWDGSEWDRIAAGVDESPVIITEPTTSVSLAANGNVSTVTMLASDPEGFDITYGVAYNNAGSNLPVQLSTATTVNANGVYTFTPSANSSHAGTFKARLSASDGAKTTTRLVDFNLTFWATVSGGDFTTVDGYNYYTFTQDGTLTVSDAGTIEYIVVAGGGGGGGFAGGGGGGGGGVRYGTTSVSAGSVTVTVGAGGTAGANAQGANGGNGGNSSLGSISATGGGGGAGHTAASGGAAQTGGSGGGGAGAGATLGAAGNAGNYTPAEGNQGGNHTGQYTGGGGGGGAGQAGQSQVDMVGGKGGDGYQWVDGRYYGGGGGGGHHTASSQGGLGGLGGGAAGGSGGDTTVPAAINNTGGGGGGAAGLGGSYSSAGGAGGSGIVIVRVAA